MKKRFKKEKVKTKDQRDNVLENPISVPVEADQELEKAILDALPAITRHLSQM